MAVCSWTAEMSGDAWMMMMMMVDDKGKHLVEYAGLEVASLIWLFMAHNLVQV